MPTDNETHPGEQALEEYALGRLDEDQAAELEEHLLICPTFQDRLAEADAFVEAARQAAHNFMMLPPSRWELIRARLARWSEHPVPVWAAAAATLLAIILLVPRFGPAPAEGGAPTLTVLLNSARGPEALAVSHAPAGRPLRLTWEAAPLAGESCCRVEVVDARGGSVVRQEAPGGSDPPEVRVQPLSPGRYWVRLYARTPQQELLREFGLEVR